MSGKLPREVRLVIRVTKDNYHKFEDPRMASRCFDVVAQALEDAHFREAAKIIRAEKTRIGLPALESTPWKSNSGINKIVHSTIVNLLNRNDLRDAAKFLVQRGPI